MRVALSLVAVTLLIQPRFSHASPAAAMTCRSTLKHVCKSGKPAKYPDILQCGDFTGFVDLTKVSGIRGVDTTQDFSIPSDTPIYATPVCSDEAREEALGQCYYDITAHSDRATAARIFELPDDYRVDPVTAVTLFRTVRRSKACQDAGIPSGSQTEAFCAGLITCRGGTTHLGVCRASGPNDCPTATECDVDLTRAGSPYQVKPDASVKLQQKVKAEPRSEVARLYKAPPGKKPLSNFSLVNDGNARPLIVSDGSGHSQCFEYLKSVDDVVGETQGSASVKTVSGTCPDLYGVLDDPCVQSVSNSRIAPYPKAGDNEPGRPQGTTGSGR